MLYWACESSRTISLGDWATAGRLISPDATNVTKMKLSFIHVIALFSIVDYGPVGLFGQKQLPSESILIILFLEPSSQEVSDQAISLSSVIFRNNSET
jgi:hypothetical protein